MKKLNGLWSESAKLWKLALWRVWAWVAFFMIIEEAMSAGISYFNNRVDERFFVMGVVLAITFQLFLSAISIVIVNQILFDIRQAKNISVLSSLRQNLKYVFIESTRAFLPIILWSLAFIVPGVVVAIRLYFVPYIAQFDLHYKEGKVDALEESRRLVRGRFGTITGILILSLIFSMVPRFGLEAVDLLKRPVLYLAVFLVSLAAEIFSDVFLFVTYEKLAEESHGTEVSRPRNT